MAHRKSRNLWTAALGLICAMCLANCNYTPPSEQKAEGSEVGGTGDIQFTHKALGADKHLLVVTAAPGLFETESSVGQRTLIFTNEFAAQECETFSFINDPNLDQDVGVGFMRRTRTFTFQCGA